MQKYLYLIILSFSLTSCYTYQVKKQAAPATDNKQASKNTAIAANNAPIQAKGIPTQPPMPVNIQDRLVPNKKFKIDVDGKSYKIMVDRWESDSLVAHPINDSKKVLKFHKKQINADKIAEKRFSKPIADIITVTAYTGIGVLIWALLR